MEFKNYRKVYEWVFPKKNSYGPLLPCDVTLGCEYYEVRFKFRSYKQAFHRCWDHGTFLSEYDDRLFIFNKFKPQTLAFLPRKHFNSCNWVLIR